LVKELSEFKEKTINDANALLEQEDTDEAMTEDELLKMLQAVQVQSGEYKAKMLELAEEANRVQNAQQNQLQGVEAVIIY
jgi:hypothetical protein